MGYWPKTTKKNKRPIRLRGLSLDMSPQTETPAVNALMTRSVTHKQSISAKSNQFAPIISPLNHADYRGEAIDEYDENMVDEYDGRGFSSGSDEDEGNLIER